ncbi:MAG: tetratricopeptide repeat protein [Saccharospirillum sp.]
MTSLHRLIPHRPTSLIACVFLLVSLCATTARADQNDPRLDPLFAALRNAGTPSVALFIEQQIWGIWMQGPDQSANRLMRRGLRSMRSGELEQALTHFDELVAEAPMFAEAWNKRATLHFMRGDYSQAMLDIEQTLELEPRHFGALSGLGIIFMELGEPVAAIRVFNQVLELHPRSRSSQRNIRRLEQQLLDRAT